MRTMFRVIALSTLAVAPLAAQGHEQTREGLAISFGVGGGSGGMSSEGGSSDRTGAPSGYFRVGTAYKPNLILSGEMNAWRKSEDGATVTIATLNASAQWYPMPENGLYLNGGLGLGQVRLSAESGGVSASTSGTGLGFQIGTGYDFRIMPNFAISPYVNFVSTAGVKVADTKLNGNAFNFGLGFSWF